MYAKDLNEAKYQFLITKRKNSGLKYFNGSKNFIENSNDIDDIYKNIEEDNTNKKRKILIVFVDVIADMPSNKKINSILTALFIRERKLSSLVFIMQSYFAAPKNIRLNSTNYFIIKNPNKREVQQVAFNHSLDIDFREFTIIYKICTAKYYSFSIIYCTLASDNPLCFGKNLKKEYES